MSSSSKSKAVLKTRAGKRCDDFGRAFAGSQLQTQIYVARRQKELSEAVLKALNESGHKFDAVRWVAPLEVKRFYEPRDAAFLTAVKLEEFRERLKEFWPKSGPRWDALALLDPGNAILLVEAKSYPAELLGVGCKAIEPARTAISRSLTEAKQHFRVEPEVDWMGRLYQYANRLAHVYFLRNQCGCQAFLANLCFVNDPHQSTSQAEWQSELRTLKSTLGFTTSIPYTVDVFLHARSRADLL